MERNSSHQPQSLPPSQSSDFDHFKVPYTIRSRSRKNSQSSTINSRENSTDRSYTNRFSSSRENSTERFQVQRDPTNWRAPIVKPSDTATDAKIAEMTKQFVDAVDLKRPTTAAGAGVIVLPNSTQLVKEAERERTSSVNKRLLNGIDPQNFIQRTLFDPKNPETPIIVTKPQHVTSRSMGDSLLDYKNFSDTKRKNRTSLSEVTSQPGSYPMWYDPASESYKKVHNSQLIEDLHAIDIELLKIVDSKELFRVSHVMCANNYDHQDPQMIFFLSSLTGVDTL